MRENSRPPGLVAIALVCVLVTVLAACGGGSYHGLSKADFIAQADARCKTDEAQFTKLAGGLGQDPSVAQIKSLYADKLIPILRSEVSALRALKPPAADRATVKTLLDEVSTGADQIDSATKQAKTMKDLQDLSPPALDQANKDATAYGLKVCGES